MAEKHSYVYLMASRRNGTLYIGVTSNLPARVWQHKNNEFEGFTKQYHVHTLVHYEEHGDMLLAIAREKQIKKWPRKQKVALIEECNSKWNDLYEGVLGD